MCLHSANNNCQLSTTYAGMMELADIQDLGAVTSGKVFRYEKKFLVFDFINCSVGNRHLGSCCFPHFGDWRRNCHKMGPGLSARNCAHRDCNFQPWSISVKKVTPTSGASPCKNQRHNRISGHDGTGRHARFRFLCSDALGFKSPCPHQKKAAERLLFSTK